MNIINNFWKFLDIKQKNFFFIIILLSIIQAILEMIGIAAAIPFVTFLLQPETLSELNIISNFIQIENINITNQIIVIFCLIFFSIFLIKNIIIVFTNKIIYNFIFSLRSKLFSNLLTKILHQEFLFFVKKGMSKIFNTTFNEVNNFSVNIAKPLIILFSEILVTLGILFLIIVTGNFKALILILPILIFVSFILKIINKSIKGWAITRIQNNEKIISYNFNLINGIKEILIFGKTKKIINDFENSLESLRGVDVKHNVVIAYPKVLLEQSVILIFILIILTMSHYGYANDRIIIILSFYLAAAYRLVPSINKIFVSYQSIKFGKPSIPKILEYYMLTNVNTFIESDDYGSKKSISFKDNIKLENINFNYDKKIQIIKKLNFKINKNEIIGISGESGTGKSTIINLLTSLIKSDSGKILIDEKQIKSPIDYRKYQNLFSITSQDTYLIDGSIKENIIFGSDGKYSEEKINNAIKFANLEKMIKDLPKGIETYIGSTIKQLSSGQKQRISIARSIYSDREILIFDEATNALDEYNEKTIFKNIKNLKVNKTIIIISHNMDNLQICDKIFKVENNKLLKI